MLLPLVWLKRHFTDDMCVVQCAHIINKWKHLLVDELELFAQIAVVVIEHKVR